MSVRSASKKKRAPEWLPRPEGDNIRLAQKVKGWFQEGVTLQKSGHFEEALALYRRVARELERANVRDASIYAAIGHVLLFLREYIASLESSQKALDIDPKYVKALINASSACRQLNRVDD